MSEETVIPRTKLTEGAVLRAAISALHAVTTDRPSAHSDAVWEQINNVLAMKDQLIIDVLDAEKETQGLTEVVADSIKNFVLYPGDRLVVSIPPDTTMDSAVSIANEIWHTLPQLADVAAAPVSANLVLRDSDRVERAMRILDAVEKAQPLPPAEATLGAFSAGYTEGSNDRLAFLKAEL